ncbi:hypothetical protein DMC30DRAFT_414726 [Rhodotorula diobovata]|uniref:C2H2-type domain-containing protein n=1 Tax=Rhodotorula diobovata TaxID=5288 RepID=A0A5C5G4L0_9BASI|nr:hypothetical protein DMC30DRAFT_414726 [Rhodotorula diobovata]
MAAPSPTVAPPPTSSSTAPGPGLAPQPAPSEAQAQAPAHACRWRFCTEVLPTGAALQAHAVAHLREAFPAAAMKTRGG